MSPDNIDRIASASVALVGTTFICAIGVGMNILFGGDGWHLNLGYVATILFLERYSHLRLASAARNLTDTIRRVLP